MCRGMPSCPWDICGGAPGGGLVGFLWGTPKASGGSRSWVFRGLELHFRRATLRLGPRGWPAVTDRVSATSLEMVYEMATSRPISI